MQSRSGSRASQSPSQPSDAGPDQLVTVRGEGSDVPAPTKVPMPVQAEDGGEVGGKLALQQMEMGLKDTLMGDESGLNPVYQMSKYQGKW